MAGQAVGQRGHVNGADPGRRQLDGQRQPVQAAAGMTWPQSSATSSTLRPASAVRLALQGVATRVACDGCPPLPDLLSRYQQAGGRYMVCPICFNAKQLDKGGLLPNAELAGTVQLWEWIGDEGATTFSY
jgi:hypothetical protein